MSAIDELPADQRAVLELVLARGRDYTQIASVLGVDRAGVRDRALSAMDALVPKSDVPEQRRALIADYLLGQLPDRISQEVRSRLEREPADRAWAQALADRLSTVAAAPLPEIPVNGVPAAAAPELSAQPAPAAEAKAPNVPTGVMSPVRRPSSRRGGAILLAGGAALVIVVAVVLIIVLGGSSHRTSPPAAASTASAGSTTSATSSTATTPPFLDNSTLSPVTAGSKAKGEAAAFNQSGALLLAVVAVNLPANSTAAGHKNFYGVWLENTPTDSRFLGLAPAVKANGQLRAATTLKSTDSRYKKILLTLETGSIRSAPGTVVLEGPFNLKSS